MALGRYEAYKVEKMTLKIFEIFAQNRDFFDVDKLAITRKRLLFLQRFIALNNFTCNFTY